jgi:hypothetical protein
LYPVLKQLADSSIPTVKVHCMTGQKPAHNSRKRACAGAQQKVKVVWDQDPCKTFRAGLREHLSQPIQKINSVGVVFKYFSPFDASDNDMVEGNRT